MIRIVAVRFPDIISLESILEKMLSMRVFEWLVSLVGCRIYGIIELEANESRKSLVGWCTLQLSRLILKSPRKKICFCSLETFSSIWLRWLLNSKTTVLGCL